MTPTDTIPPPPPAASPPPPPPGRRLVRRRSDRLVGGVASGVADHLGVDPILVRVGFVLAALFGLSGLVVYLVMWAVVPEEGTGDTILRQQARWAQGVGPELPQRRWPFWIGVGLIAIAGVSLLDQFYFVDTGVLWAVVLMGIGVALFRSTEGGVGPREQAAAPDGPRNEDLTRAEDLAGAREVAAADQDPVLDPPTWSGPPTQAAGIVPPQFPYGNPSPVAPVPVPPRPPRPPRERSNLGRLTLGIAVLWLGGASLLDEASSSISFTTAGLVGVAMAIVGIGLLVGAFVGRARWLILVGILLTPVLLAASFVDRIEVPFRAGVGERFHGLTDQDPDLRADLFAGEMVIDLALDGEDGLDRTVVARVGTGRILVQMPVHWTLELHASVDAGQIVVHDGRGGWTSPDQGLGANVDQTYPGVVGAPTARLDLTVVVGQIEIHRYETAATHASREEVAG